MYKNHPIHKTKTLIALLIATAFILPFFFLFSTALRTPADFAANPGGLPTSFTLDNLKEAWVKANLGSAVIVTFIMSTVACVSAISTSLAAAFWFHINSNKWAQTGRLIMMAGYTIPSVAWLIPVFVLLSKTNLTGNIYVAGFLNGAASLPFAIYFFYTYFKQAVKKELLEAARLDGAKIFTQFFKIAVPLSRPAIASAATLIFVWTFGDLLIAATLLGAEPDSYSLPLAATTLASKDSVNLQGQAAAALVSLIPVLLVFAVAQKYLAAGFGGTSEK